MKKEELENKRKNRFINHYCLCELTSEDMQYFKQLTKEKQQEIVNIIFEKSPKYI